MDRATVLAKLKESLIDVPGWYAVTDRLEKAIPEAELGDARAWLWAFAYRYVPARLKDERTLWKGAFGPCFLADDRPFPPPLADVPEEIVKEWAAVADEMTDPVAVSRLNDLLWVRRFQPRPDQRARSAIDAYLQLGRGGWPPTVRVTCLERALELADALSDEARLAETKKALVEIVRAAIAEGTKPGVAKLGLKALLELKAGALPPEIDDLISASAKAFRGDPDSFIGFKDLEASRKASDADAVRRIRLEQLGRLREHAEALKELPRFMFLQRALDHARRYKLKDEAVALRLEIQNVGLEQLRLQSFSGSVEIPAEWVDQQASPLSCGDNWFACLNLLGLYGPPSGDPEANRAQVDARIAQFPLQMRIGELVLDRDGYPFRKIETKEDRREVELTRLEHDAIGPHVYVLVRALDKIIDRFGPPIPEQLAAYFSCSFIPDAVAERLARGIVLYVEGQYDEAAHVLAPRVETVIRQLAERSGAVIIKEPVGTAVGGVRSAGELISALQGKVPEEWRRYIRAVVTEPLAFNLRNRICHGLLERAGPVDAALLIHVACVLRLLETPEEPRATEAPA